MTPTLVNLALTEAGLTTPEVNIISQKIMPNSDGTHTVKVKYTEHGNDEIKIIRKVYSLKDMKDGN